MVLGPISEQARELDERDKARKESRERTRPRGESPTSFKEQFTWENLGPKKKYRGADLHGQDLSGYYYEDADFAGANMMDTDLRGANMNGTNLRNANLKGALLTDTHLRQANLQGANLSEAEMRRAVLSEANLSNDDLTEADLRGANLLRARFDRADLTDAKLKGAILWGAKVDTAKGMSEEDRRRARTPFARAGSMVKKFLSRKGKSGEAETAATVEKRPPSAASRAAAAAAMRDDREQKDKNRSPRKPGPNHGLKKNTGPLPTVTVHKKSR